MGHDLLTVKQAAEYLGVVPGTLNFWRCTGKHRIPYLKVGKLVKYRRSDLDEWLASRVVNVGPLPQRGGS